MNFADIIRKLKKNKNSVYVKPIRYKKTQENLEQNPVVTEDEDFRKILSANLNEGRIRGRV